ncbi:hypothetical protein LYSIN_01004 [Lysinibacillus sphaericus]|uniref:Uncharacterized protein n=1 Tax=Lysinibacillus sphaericus TaxID=1421 RepID=A0A2S5CZI5_LYSSH|nr:hypothetical protein [Lysinibacillus sphaericus]POZ56221.1 hypothetical protein LYSIN_01004 [Lysinibacillus sphaericus]
MDIFSGISLGGSLLFLIPPLILLPVVMVVCVAIYKTLFGKILPTKIYNFFLGPVALLGFFVWAIPMKTGFYEVFRAML